MNIILVIFDSLRKDCVGIYGSPPWGKVYTPHFDAFARESLVFTRAYPDSLPTLPARRAIYTGRRVYPYLLDGDLCLKDGRIGTPGWGPIPENQPTLAEILSEDGYRTGLISDAFPMFEPSRNFWRGFDQWEYLRGNQGDPSLSGPLPTQAEIDRWLPQKLQTGEIHVPGSNHSWRPINSIRRFIINIRDRIKEEDYFAPRVLKEAALWLEQNRDADKFFLTVESFDPHEFWFIPEHYRKMYLKEDGQE